MSDADNFGIKYSAKFQSTYKNMFGTHYGRNTQGGDELEELFDVLEESLAVEPRAQYSVSEPWPGNFGRPEWDLRKLKFYMPGLKGASKLGRLLYIVDEQREVVHLLWVYTHQEFAKQPPTKDLKKAVREIVRHLND